jgi:hypothetical protein
VAFAYLAPHTPRPDLLAPVEETPAVPTAPADLERHTEPIERLKVPDHEDHGVDLFRGA